MIVHTGHLSCSCCTHFAGDTSPPSTSIFVGINISPTLDACKPARCEGTIFKYSMPLSSKYSASAQASNPISCGITCKQPPVTRDGNITVLPKSAASVDNIAYLAPATACIFSDMHRL